MAWFECVSSYVIVWYKSTFVLMLYKRQTTRYVLEIQTNGLSTYKRTASALSAF